MERKHLKFWALPYGIGVRPRYYTKLLKPVTAFLRKNRYKNNNLLGRHEFAKSELSNFVEGFDLAGVALRNHWLYHKLSRDM